MEKRHCVLISGFIRNYEDYLGQIKSNIITRDKIDVFLCLWDTINYSQDWHNGSYDSANRTPNSNTINVENIKKDFNPAVLKILKYSDYDTIFTESTNIFVNMNINYNNFIKNYQGNRKLVDRIKSKFKSSFSKFFILKKCFELVEEYSKQNNIEYINVCRIRSELGNPKYKGFYPVINWDKEYTELYIHDWCSTKRKNITKWCNWSGAHGNYKQMKIYCNIFSFLHLLNVKFDEFLCCFAKYGLFGQDKIWGDDMCTYLYLKHFNIPYLLCNGKNEESKNSLENKEFKEFNYMSSNNKFFHKEWLENINRVHPPKEEQMVNDKLRLHRAERIFPFPNSFFEEFTNSIKQEDIRYYPYVHSLKEKLASIYELNVNNLLLNNGSSENIRIFYEAFAIQNKNVIITNPCYPMHKIYAQFHNSNIIEINYNNLKQVNYQDLIDNIDSSTCCIVLANPNSPIGDILDLNKIEKILLETNKLDIPILIDEAYIEYADQESCVRFLKKYDNLVISRTFSKAYGCAGLRIGYLMANNEIMEVINRFVPTYEITALSAKFGIHLLNNKKIINDYIELIKKEKKIIEHQCKENNIEVILNHINTIFIKTKNLNLIKKYLNDEKVFYRTRKLPYDDEDWLAIVLYPDFSKSELFNKIKDNNI